MNETQQKSNYSFYLDELTELAKQEVEDRLKTKLRARIYEKDGPSLLRDEYDETDVLFLVYAERRKAGDERSMRHLRKVAVELFMEAMNETHPDLTVINHLGHLVALYEFRKDKPLADHLSNELFGFLSSRLPLPLEEIADLDGRQLALAVNALDMWIATNSFSDKPHLPEHTLERIKNLFLQTVETVGSSVNLKEEKLRLLRITFQAIILLQPRWTGREGLLKMTDAIYKLSRDLKMAKRRWFGLCHEYAALFRQIPEWQTTFWNGVYELKQSGQLTRIGDLLPLLEDSLERLGFEEKIKSLNIENTSLEQVRTEIKSLIAEIIGIPEDKIEDNASLADVLVDSLMSVQIIASIEKMLCYH